MLDDGGLSPEDKLKWLEVRSRELIQVSSALCTEAAEIVKRQRAAEERMRGIALPEIPSSRPHFPRNKAG